MIELFLIGLVAFIMEIIDSGLGMGYGTVLTPVLLLFGFEPITIIPSILFSQAIGGLTASIFHQKMENVDFGLKSFKWGSRKDLKIVLIITAPGILVTTSAVFVAINIPKIILKLYIGLLILGVGILMASRKKFIFSWRKIFGLGLLASFNKGISGGGFGPVMTGGQIISGRNHRSAIGCTIMAEAPICLAGFISYVILSSFPSFFTLIPLSIGTLLAAPLGPSFTKTYCKTIRKILTLLIIFLGVLTLIKLFV